MFVGAARYGRSHFVIIIEFFFLPFFSIIICTHSPLHKKCSKAAVIISRLLCLDLQWASAARNESKGKNVVVSANGSHKLSFFPFLRGAYLAVITFATATILPITRSVPSVQWRKYIICVEHFHRLIFFFFFLGWHVACV